MPEEPSNEEKCVDDRVNVPDSQLGAENNKDGKASAEGIPPSSSGGREIVRQSGRASFGHTVPRRPEMLGGMNLQQPHRRHPIVRKEPALSPSQTMPTIHRSRFSERTSSSSDVSTSSISCTRLKSDRYSYDQVTRRFRSTSPPQPNLAGDKSRIFNDCADFPPVEGSIPVTDFQPVTPSADVSTSSSLSSLCTSSATNNRTPPPRLCFPRSQQWQTSSRHSSNDQSTPGSTALSSHSSTPGQLPTSARISREVQHSLHDPDEKFRHDFQALSEVATRLARENEGLRALTIEMSRRASHSPILRSPRSVSSSEDETLVSSAMLDVIRHMRREKEQLVNQYEREEEFLTNTLNRKLIKLREEKDDLERTLEEKQDEVVKSLLSKIDNLEAKVRAKQNDLNKMQLQRFELENTLEREQESIVLRLSRKIRHLENEKSHLEQRLEEQWSYYNAEGASGRNASSERARRRILLQRAVLGPFRLKEAATQTFQLAERQHSAEGTIESLRQQVQRLTSELEEAELKWKQKEEELLLANTGIIDSTRSEKKKSKTERESCMVQPFGENLCTNDDQSLSEHKVETIEESAIGHDTTETETSTNAEDRGRDSAERSDDTME